MARSLVNAAARAHRGRDGHGDRRPGHRGERDGSGERGRSGERERRFVIRASAVRASTLAIYHAFLSCIPIFNSMSKRTAR